MSPLKLEPSQNQQDGAPRLPAASRFARQINTLATAAYQLRRASAIVLATISLTACAQPEHTPSDQAQEKSTPKRPAGNVAEADRALERAATEALGDREGAVLVMDPQTGRLRAVVTPRLAFEQAFPPGSTLKTLTALAAMRAGLIDGESRYLCRGRYTRNATSIVCSHPRSPTPFDTTQALAYSCNVYFATLAERISASAFTSTLSSFGFGERTGVNAGRESSGSIRGGEWRIQDALGEGDGLLATPIQLLAAYSAVFNGGRLLRPQRADASNFIAEERVRVDVDPAHWKVLVRGCRSAVEYGTAARAGLVEFPFFVFGKTGTSTASNGFRRQGWFVAFAADPGAVGPESLRLAVLVFAKRSHGSECATAARRVFEEYKKLCDAGVEDCGSQAADGARSTAERIQSQPDTPAASDAEHSTLKTESEAADNQIVRVRLLREARTETLSLEEYVVGVMAAEASVEDEREALRAQAVISRTFALKNLRRHGDEGYDLCSNTHCQQYSARAAARVREALRLAVLETGGEVLVDARGQIADAYFHAACGGMTANVETLWGVESPSYLRGVRDDFCVSTANRNWTDEIPRDRLSRALRSDPRSDPGPRLDDVVVTRRDATGRAEVISIEGERRRRLRGWEFKMIVGRALGWNILKSSRFQVSRRGASFVFRGSGFGHGLGMCQQGAHVMAKRGAAYRKILDHYFPGTRLATRRLGAAATGERGMYRRLSSLRVAQNVLMTAHRGMTADRRLDSLRYIASVAVPLSWGRRRLSLSSEHFRVSYPAALERSEVEPILRTLDAANADLRRRLANASLGNVTPAPVEVFIHETTASFIAATGQPGWVAAATRGRRIELQPVGVLRKRGVLASTLRHEYAHVVIEALGRGRTPRWLAEGLAVHFAGEGAKLARLVSKPALPLEAIEKKLERPGSSREMRSLYAEAYGRVIGLIRNQGEAAVWRFLSRPEIDGGRSGTGYDRALKPMVSAATFRQSQRSGVLLRLHSL